LDYPGFIFAALNELSGLRAAGSGGRSSAPIFFSLSLHCRRLGILDLDPVRRSARPIGRTKPLGNDPLATELAGVVEDDRAFDIEGAIVGNARMRLAQQLLECRLSLLAAIRTTTSPRSAPSTFSSSMT